MKIVYKIGAVMSMATVFSMAYIGTNAINQAEAAQNFTTLEQHRIEVELEAQRFVTELGEEQLQCLARNIFFEARDQSISGQVAVAWVTLNRVGAERFPDTICGVVHQANRDSAGNPILHQCQFSWYCDGKSDNIPDNPISQRAWEDAQLIAEVVLLDYARGRISPIEDATMYHASYVNPYWAKDYEIVDVIEDHVFYR